MTLAPQALLGAALLAVPLVLVAQPAAATFTSTTGVHDSFDGTPIVFTLFEPSGASSAHPVPVVLRTHGWGGSRETTPSSTTQALLDDGYAVLTWDARGFGESGGKVELDSPDYEVRDVQSLLDMVQAQPEILSDAHGVVAAMSGGSYAGGIQLLSAAYDPRIRAMAPEITWNDLRYSLLPNGVVKEQWIQLLFWDGLASSQLNGAGLHRDPTSTSPPSTGDVGFGPAGPQTGGYDTNLPTYYAETMATNGGTADALAALAYRSPSQHAATIAIPTLLIQGWPDSLFTVNEAERNFALVTGNGAPAKMILYCGGHAGCPYDSTGEREHLDAAIVAWFDRYVRGESVATGATVEYFTSGNVLETSASWPIPSTPVAATGSATLVDQPVPTGGGLVIQSGSSMPSQDPTGSTSARIPLPVAGGAEVTGIPHVSLQVGGTSALAGDGTLFFRLVDATAGTVVDGQTTPLRLTGASSYQLDLYGVSYTLPAGHQLALEVATSDAAFSASRLPGVVTVGASVTVPVVG